MATQTKLTYCDGCRKELHEQTLTMCPYCDEAALCIDCYQDHVAECREGYSGEDGKQED